VLPNPMSNLTINASRFLGFFLEKRNSAQKKKKIKHANY
jgi:hypothetical protein